MKYFVTGATGFIGGRLVRQLREAGHEVTALVRDPAKAAELAALGIVLSPGDVTDKESMRRPMTGADGVYHVAGWYKIGIRDKSAGQKVNVEGTRNVLELMQSLGIPRGVYTSTLAIFSDTHSRVPNETYVYYGPHLSEYNRTKWVAHHEVAVPMMQAGLPLTIVLPGLVYGPGDTSPLHDTFEQYLMRRLPVVPKENAYAWGHVDDIARGHILAMDQGKPGQEYIISGPVHTFVDVLARCRELTGVPLPIQIPGVFLSLAVHLSRLLEKVIPLPETYSSEGLRNSAGVTYLGDNSKAKRDLGYQPRSIEKGLPETMAWEMAQLGKKAPLKAIK